MISARSTPATEPDNAALPGKHICLLGLSLEVGNRGVGALVSGTICALVQAFPRPDIFLLDYGKTSVNHKVRCYDGRVELINLRFSTKLYLENNIARLLFMALVLRFLPNGRLRRRLVRNNRCLKRIFNASFLASIAGGDSFSDIYGLRRLIYVALPQLLGLALGRPLILLPQTIGPFATSTGRWIARSILCRATQIYTRDLESQAEVESLLGRRPQNIAFAYDMGFALEAIPPSGSIRDKLGLISGAGDLVGVNVSGLLYRNNHTGKNRFGLQSDYPRLVRKLIEFVIETLGLRVLLISHVFGVRLNSGSDNIVSEQIWEELRPRYDQRLDIVRDHLDQHEVKWVIGQCDLFIGSRMHACIAAVSQCVPAVGLAYSRKFAGVLSTIGGGAFVVDLRHAGVDRVLSVVSHAFSERISLRGQLQTRMPTVKESALNLFTSMEGNLPTTTW